MQDKEVTQRWNYIQDGYVPLVSFKFNWVPNECEQCDSLSALMKPSSKIGKHIQEMAITVYVTKRRSFKGVWYDCFPLFYNKQAIYI